MNFLWHSGQRSKRKFLYGGSTALGIDESVFLVAQELADRFHVIVVEVGLGDLRGIVSGEHFHLHHEAAVVADGEFFTADITANMQHERLQKRYPKKPGVPHSGRAAAFRENRPGNSSGSKHLPYPSVAGLQFPVKLNPRKVAKFDEGAEDKNSPKKHGFF